MITRCSDVPDSSGTLTSQGELIVRQPTVLRNLLLLLPIHYMPREGLMCFLKENRTVELLLPLHEHAQGSPSTCSVCFIRVVFRFFQEKGGGEESSLVGLHDAISSSRKDGAWLLRISHVRTIMYQSNPWRKAKIKNIALHKHTVTVQGKDVFLCVQGVSRVCGVKRSRALHCLSFSLWGATISSVSLSVEQNSRKQPV